MKSNFGNVIFEPGDIVEIAFDRDAGEWAWTKVELIEKLEYYGGWPGEPYSLLWLVRSVKDWEKDWETHSGKTGEVAERFFTIIDADRLKAGGYKT